MYRGLQNCSEQPIKLRTITLESPFGTKWKTWKKWIFLGWQNLDFITHFVELDPCISNVSLHLSGLHFIHIFATSNQYYISFLRYLRLCSSLQKYSGYCCTRTKKSQQPAVRNSSSQIYNLLLNPSTTFSSLYPTTLPHLSHTYLQNSQVQSPQLSHIPAARRTPFNFQQLISHQTPSGNIGSLSPGTFPAPHIDLFPRETKPIRSPAVRESTCLRV